MINMPCPRSLCGQNLSASRRGGEGCRLVVRHPKRSDNSRNFTVTREHDVALYLDGLIYIPSTPLFLGSLFRPCFASISSGQILDLQGSLALSNCRYDSWTFDRLNTVFEKPDLGGPRRPIATHASLVQDKAGHEAVAVPVNEADVSYAKYTGDAAMSA